MARHTVAFAVRWTSVLTALCGSAPPARALDWSFEVVDAGAGIGAYSSIGIGPADEVHISYFSGGQGIMKYAFYDGSQWLVEVADDQFLTGHHTSLEVDSAGKPHVAYRFYSGHNVRYASRDGAWTHSDFETDGDMESDISLALDGLDRPHVSFHDGYFEGEFHDLKYARLLGSSWLTQTVDGQGNVGRGSSIDVDSDDRPHISYYDETQTTLKYAHFDGSQWQTTTVDDVEFIAFNFRTAISVDSRDRVHIVYSAYHYQAPDWYGQLRYAFYDGDGWTVTVVDQSLPNRDFRVPAVTVDADDHPITSYLIYYNAEPITADLKVATFDGAEWHAEFVDTGDIADSDHSNAIDLDSRERIHISYARSGSLIHAVAETVVGLDTPAPAAAGLALSPPVPNPCRRAARLTFELDRPAAVRCELFDASGRRVRSLAEGWYGAGSHPVASGDGLSPGVYFVRVTAGGPAVSRKLIIG